MLDYSHKINNKDLEVYAILKNETKTTDFMFYYEMILGVGSNINIIIKNEGLIQGVNKKYTIIVPNFVSKILDPKKIYRFRIKIKNLSSWHWIVFKPGLFFLNISLIF